MEAKQYEIRQNIKFQENQSAIRIEKIRKKSCTGKYMHIDIRLFCERSS